MIPSILDIKQLHEPHGDVWSQDDAPQEETPPIEHDPNWFGTMTVGAILIVMGLAMIGISPTFGGGAAFFGVLLVVGSYIAGKSDIEWEGSLDEDTQWSQMEKSIDWEQDARGRQEARQKEINEIVKAVKTTIRIRCRYCGTLNEEKANKCESCGGSL